MIELLGTAPTFNDPLGMLRACHRRIERALAELEQVVEREAAGPLDAESRQALGQVLHYFATSVPRHAADEEQSLFPHLRAVLEGRDPESLAALEALEQEHVAAETAHQQLEDLGQELLESGRFQQGEKRQQFSRTSAQLQQLYREHIRREDDQVLPLAAAVVGSTALQQVGADMAARRGIDWQQHQHLVARLEARPFVRR